MGPYGYLPTDPKQLSDELAARNLKLSAGTVFEHLHQSEIRGDDSWNAVWKQIEDVAKLTAAVGGKHVVVIPEMWRDPSTGAVLEDRNLTPAQWRQKTEGMNELGKAMFEKYGVRAQYHPHADSHVDTEENVYRFLDGTDGEFVNLCLDTGHISYCGGDNIAIIERAPERIGYLHLKQVDPVVRAKVEAEDLPFGEAVKLGAMTEPPVKTMPLAWRASARLVLLGGRAACWSRILELGTGQVSSVMDDPAGGTVPQQQTGGLQRRHPQLAAVPFRHRRQGRPGTPDHRPGHQPRGQGRVGRRKQPGEPLSHAAGRPRPKDPKAHRHPPDPGRPRHQRRPPGIQRRHRLPRSRRRHRHRTQRPGQPTRLRLPPTFAKHHRRSQHRISLLALGPGTPHGTLAHLARKYGSSG